MKGMRKFVRLTGVVGSSISGLIGAGEILGLNLMEWSNEVTLNHVVITDK